MGIAAQSKVGVLVAQLGTPEAPTAKGLRPYLKQFLSDTRVIDYPPWVWQPILRGAVLPRRPVRSARLYSRIWTDEGSPLLVYSNKQIASLQERLGAGCRVILGMTYGEPSISRAVATLEAEGIDRLIVLPMFPQYSSTTTASIYDAVYAAAAGKAGLFHVNRKRFVPALRFIAAFYDAPDYIESMRQHLSETVGALPDAPDKYVITFHGIPDRYIQTGDPYRAQCERTARLLADAMNWDDSQWVIGFQSRFGREEWLAPYTEEVLTGLHKQGVQRPLVFSPGFVTDCLETLDELGNEGREQFAHGGGDPEKFRLAPCLNDHPAWIDVMADLVRQNAGGWVDHSSALAFNGASREDAGVSQYA